MEIIFSKRTSVEEVEEGKTLQPKFDENGLIPVITIDIDDNQETANEMEYRFPSPN